jgi:hypothetical protein
MPAECNKLSACHYKALSADWMNPVNCYDTLHVSFEIADNENIAMIRIYDYTDALYPAFATIHA